MYFISSKKMHVKVSEITDYVIENGRTKFICNKLPKYIYKYDCQTLLYDFPLQYLFFKIIEKNRPNGQQLLLFSFYFLKMLLTKNTHARFHLIAFLWSSH